MSPDSDAAHTIRVVVVDDHPVVRDGLRLMLEILGQGFSVVGEAADGALALEVVEQVQPDVVLMDLRMPGLDGLEAITQLRRRWPQLSVVILTTYHEDALMLRGLQAGACGYLLKDVGRETLFQAIRSAARGESLLQPDTMARLLAQTTRSAVSPVRASAHPLELTAREREVLGAVARGERSKEIASRLGLSERTVNSHLTSIFTKLGVDSRAAAVAIALERGLLPRL